jgi:hypothetical protein
MASTTGIELGPDRSLLVGVRTTRSGAEVVALHIVEPDDWPAHDVAFVELLRNVRKSKRFPRDARVVAWGLPDDATDDSIARAALRPIVDAGFRIDRVLTPPQALAMIARTRRKPGVQNAAVAWLSLNMHGAAIAIVRDSELLFARTFQWTYNPHLLEGKAQLLQRYSLIAHLEPEVRRGIAAVRASHGVKVDTAVTCGDLPELRSLTMPLIEELDLEVETLDSMDGLRPAGTARHERLAEYAPAMRLACAAALVPDQRRRTNGTPQVARIAAVIALVAALGYGAYAYFGRLARPVMTPRAPQPAVALKSASPSVATKTVAPPVPRTRPDVAASAATPTIYPPAQPLQRPPNPVTAQTRATTPKPLVERRRTTAANPEAASFAPSDRAAEPSRQQALKDPLPKIDSILIDQDRRLAIVDGAVLAVGDRVGQRVIEGIDRDFILLREPSGVLVRVPLRSRQ